VAIALLADAGGSLLTNAISVLFSVVAVGAFLYLCKSWNVHRPRTLALLLALNPTFWIAATSTMDYNWALALLLLGFVAIERSRVFPAAVLFGLAIAVRLSSVIFGLALVEQKDQRKQVFLSGVLALILGVLFYVPSYNWAGHSFTFLTAAIGEARLWTPMMRLGRFVYRNVYVLGIPAWSVIGWALLRGLRPQLAPVTENSGRRSHLLVLCVAMLLAFEALYLKYPLDKAYLIPAFPFAIILLGLWLAPQPRTLTLLLCLSTLHGFIRLNVARPNARNSASDAK
jgi:hypothetical protein